MPTINLYFISHTRVVESASERTNRTKIEAGWHTSTTSLASRCDFCFDGRKSLVGGSFAKDYNFSPPSAHRFMETPGNELPRNFRSGRRSSGSVKRCAAAVGEGGMAVEGVHEVRRTYS
jgi:hypothetical protein